MIFEGAVSVKAILKYHRRTVDEIIIDEAKQDRNTRFILEEAKRQGIAVRREQRQAIDAVCSGKTHGGIYCVAKERNYQSLSQVLKINHPFFLIVDGIEDPFNLGYIFRTAVCAGCAGIFVNQRDWSHVEPVICKASAGAFEALNIIQVKDWDEVLSTLKQHHISIYCAMRKDCIDYTEADYTQSCCLAIGGEKRGLSKEILSASTQNIVIPYANDFRNALNASSAVAVLAYEVFRQRKGER